MSDPFELAGRYDAEYYASHVGPEPYRWDNPAWLAFFGNLADWIARELRPRTVLDAGCGIGFLVGALRERGIDASGIEISEYALSQVPAELQPFCSRASIAQELDGRYDLITCIEIVEHLPEADARHAVANLSRHTDTVLFSSTPDDFVEPTHLTVRPTSYWVHVFASEGLFRDVDADLSFVAPHALLLRRATPDAADLALEYERLVEAQAKALRKLRAVVTSRRALLRQLLRP